MTKECPYCGEDNDAAAENCQACGKTLLANHGGGQIATGDMTDVRGAAVGTGAQAVSAGNVSGSIIQAQGDVTLGKSQREEQYEIALAWDGRRRMREFDLSNRDLSDLTLAGADLRRANLSGANLSKIDLSRAELSDADLRGAGLPGARLVEADMEGADLRGAYLVSAVLDRTNLRRANLQETFLSAASLREANLAGADLLAANLARANLASADLSWSRLSEANLYLADLDRADLTAANLRGASLRGAYLHEADLSGADLSTAVIQGEEDSPDLTPGEESGPKYRDETYLRGAKYTTETKWPDGFDPQAAGAILVDAEGNPVTE